MPPIRPVLTLLATVVLLSPTAAARAASSKLTPNPPVPLPQTTVPHPTAATTGPSTGAIPRTGDDLPAQIFVAGCLIGAGAVLRARPPLHRG
ncbi:MAG TPA: hypothetical protein VMU39_08825 [Solirubrobacteraceae bacterium]|nr:hypothetical protein [Solirubrobacteraceae bacterium]